MIKYSDKVNGITHRITPYLTICEKFVRIKGLFNKLGLPAWVSYIDIHPVRSSKLSCSNVTMEFIKAGYLKRKNSIISIYLIDQR